MVGGNMLNLSPDQQVALDDIDNLFNSEYREQVLTGGPGMGKSFLTGKVVGKALSAGYQLILCATTHPATKVLGDFTGEEVVTLHKLLDLKVKNDYVNNTTYVEQLVNRKGPMISQLVNTYNPFLVIIDEASFIDEELNEYIQDALESYTNMIILYIGDKDQLPPVGSEVPYIFNAGKPTSTLTTDHRFDSNSQMAEMVKILKSNIQDKSYYLTEVLDGPEISILDENAFLKQMDILYNDPRYLEDHHYVKTMAYRNKVVDNMNNHIRKFFYEGDTFQEGERLLVGTALCRGTDMLANNGDVVEVQEVSKTELLGVEGHELLLHSDRGKMFSAIVTTHHRKKSIEQKKLVAAKKWKELYAFMESFIQVKQIYASTIHKAQGASYQNVMLHLDDLVECTDHTLLARLLLVAVSRASEHVYVYGSVPQRLLRSA
jgi:ATP-dependent exoDNAse (exonuclease V) alpha subunit